MRVGDAVLAHACAAPDRIAVRDGLGAVAYGELAERIGLARDHAAALPAARVVAVVAARPAALLASFLGCALAGRVAFVGDGRAQPPGDAVDPALDCFYAGLTSGTSGEPKPFVRSHRSWLASFAGSDVVFGIGPDDTVLAPGPLAHSHFLYAAVQALHAGATVVAPGRFEPAAVVAALAAGATRLVVVPTMLVDVVDRAPRAPALRSVICSGAKLAPALAARCRAALPAADLYEFYGASELSFVAVRRDGDGAPPESVGRPFPAVEVRIVDGEIHVRSPLVFAGYLGGAADGAARLLADGWATVGDRGRIADDGCLHVDGRAGSLLIVGGVNVYPERVERTLEAHPQVAEAAVVGVADARWGQVPVAFVVARGSAPTAAGLRAHVAASGLERIARPRRYVVVDALPRTASGKLARGELAARAGGTSAPASP